MEKRKVKLTPMAWFVLVLSMAITLYLYLPMISGIISIIYQSGDVNKPFQLSIEPLTGIIVLATALGGFILWFVERKPKKEVETDSFVRSVKGAGKLFLYSALLLSLFMILSPLTPTVKDATDWYSVGIKYIMVFAFLGGGVAFIFANIMALMYVWKL